MGTVHPVIEQVCLHLQPRRLPVEYSPPQSRGGLFSDSLMLGERASGVEKNRPLIPLLTAKTPATRVNSAVVLFCAFSGEFDRFEAKNNGVAQ